jgi:tetratricopeptide (TPR) repeat protein
MMKVGLKGLMNDTRLLTRLVIVAGIALLLIIIGFGVYYYYDRYYSAQPSSTQMTLSDAQQELAKDPQNDAKRLALADTQLMNGKYDDAIKNASQVMMKDAENQDAWLILGVGYALKNEPDAAIEPLTKYVAANRDSEMPGLNKRLQAAAYYLGEAYLKQGQPEMAIEPLELTVGWNRMDSDALYQLGLAYSGVGRYEQAVTVLNQATIYVPDFLEAYQAMAEVTKLMNEPDYENYALGMVAYSQKDYDKAVETLLKVVQARPDFAPAYSGLGLTYEAQGKLKEAKESYDAAYKLDPNSFTAQNGSERVGILLNK